MIERPTYALPRRPRRRAAAPLAAALALSLAAMAHAQGEPDATREARERFRRGVELYKEGDYRAALLEFKHAYSISPNYVVLFNLGQSHYELRDYAEAKHAFETYLREGGAAVPPDRRRHVEAELERLASRVASLEVRSNADGAELLVDDMPVAKTPLSAPLVVSAGRRKLTLVKAPAPPVTKYVDLAGGVSSSIELALPTAAPSPQPAPAGTRPDRRELASPTNYGPAWAALAVTGAFAAGAAAAGVLSLSSQNKLDDRLDRAPTDEANVGGLRDDVRRWSLVTDLALGATAVAGGVTLYLFLNGRGEPPKRGQAAPATNLTFGPQGLTLRGRF